MSFSSGSSGGGKRRSSSLSLASAIAPVYSCVTDFFADEDADNTNERLQREEREIRAIYEEGLRLKRRSKELSALLADTEDRRLMDRQEFDAILSEKDALAEHLRSKHALDMQAFHDQKQGEFHDLLRQLVDARNAGQRAAHEAEELRKWAHTLEQDAARQQAFFQQTVQDMAETHSDEIRDISLHVGRETSEGRDVLLRRAMQAEAQLARLTASRAAAPADSGGEGSPVFSPGYSPTPISASASPFGPPPPRPEYSPVQHQHQHCSKQDQHQDGKPPSAPSPTLAALVAARLEVTSLEAAVAEGSQRVAALQQELSTEQLRSSALAAEGLRLGSRVADLVASKDAVEACVRQVKEENDRLATHVKVLTDGRARDRVCPPQPFLSVYTTSSTSSSQEPSPRDGSGSSFACSPFLPLGLLSPMRSRPATLCSASPPPSRSAGLHGISTAPPLPVSGSVSRAPSLNSRNKRPQGAGLRTNSIVAAPPTLEF